MPPGNLSQISGVREMSPVVWQACCHNQAANKHQHFGDLKRITDKSDAGRTARGVDASAAAILQAVAKACHQAGLPLPRPHTRLPGVMHAPSSDAPSYLCAHRQTQQMPAS